MSRHLTAECFIADLDMVVTNLSATHARLTAECQEHGADFTPREEGKWEGGWYALRGVLVDELQPMLSAWKAGEPYSRASELMLTGPDPAIEELRSALSALRWLDADESRDEYERIASAALDGWDRSAGGAS